MRWLALLVAALSLACLLVFADDSGAGFDPAQREDYLKVRAMYGKLISLNTVFS